MKSLNKLILVFIAISVIACGTAETNTEAENEVISESSIDLSDMEEFDLSEYDMPISIYLSTNNGKPEITATDWGSVEIRIGTSFGMEITPNGFLVEEKKVELEKDLVYTYDFIEENPELIIYEQRILDSGVEPEFHFFMNSTIGGEVYEIKSLADISFKKTQLDKMLNAAKTIKIKPIG